jgi:surfeit locus 1 family protein
VRLTGRFLNEKERYWFSDGRLGSGFQVFTPLEIAPHQVVWVNRGYVPEALRDPQNRNAGQSRGETEVVGLVRTPGEHNLFTPANDVVRNVWYWRDLPALQESAFPPDTQYAPVMVDADAVPANPGGWPEGGASLPNLPNRHLEYAITWYGLALALIAVFFSYARTRLTGRRE